MRTGRVFLKKCYARSQAPALGCDWEALEEEVATGWTACCNNVKEEAMGRDDRPEGIQQNQYAIGGPRPSEEEPRNDEQLPGHDGLT